MKTNSGQFKKGVSSWNKGTKGIMKPWNKNVPHSEATKEKMRQAKLVRPTKFWLGKKRPSITGENSSCWKGEKVQYRGLHNWVEKELGKPCTCEDCGKTNLEGHQIHWANISRNYKRITTDWRRLCVKCHKAFDK